MRRSILKLGSCFVFSISSLSAQAQLSLAEKQKNDQITNIGRLSFANRCSGCHGVEADGKGESAKMLNPKPRNLKEGSFKFRSTPSGSLPTDDDLMRTLNQGIVGTSMPSFKFLSTQEKLALIAYIKSLREWKKAQALDMPDEPASIFESKKALFESAKKGQKIYAEICMTCHGAEGRGDGEGAVGLTDEDGNPILPANLRKNYVKGGKSAHDIFRAISAGLDGTPMVSFADTYSVDERWALTAFIFYLRGEESGIYKKGELARVTQQEESSIVKSTSTQKTSQAR